MDGWMDVKWYCNHLQLDKLEHELASDRESLCTAESLSTDLMKEKALLEKSLETLRENSERQVDLLPRPLSMNHVEKVVTFFFPWLSSAEGSGAGEQAPGPNRVVPASAVPGWC